MNRRGPPRPGPPRQGLQGRLMVLDRVEPPDLDEQRRRLVGADQPGQPATVGRAVEGGQSTPLGMTRMSCTASRSRRHAFGDVAADGGVAVPPHRKLVDRAAPRGDRVGPVPAMLGEEDLPEARQAGGQGGVKVGRDWWAWMTSGR